LALFLVLPTVRHSVAAGLSWLLLATAALAAYLIDQVSIIDGDTLEIHGTHPAKCSDEPP
jgi:hypothetical protein